MLSATSGSHVPVAPVLSLRDCSYLGAKGLLKDRAELGRGAAWGQGHGGHQPQVGGINCRVRQSQKKETHLGDN